MAMPGVLGVLHHGNAPRLTPGAGYRSPDASLLMLQDDHVPHRGWPVALVVAETPEQARAGAEALAVTYDEEPHEAAFSADHERAHTPEVRPPAQPDVVKGDVDAEIAASALVVDEEYTTPEQYHNAMEPHSIVVSWDGDRLSIDTPTQGLAMAKARVAALFGIPADNVHIRSPFLGGGFGSKGLFSGPQVLGILLGHRPMNSRLVSRRVSEHPERAAHQVGESTLLAALARRRSRIDCQQWRLTSKGSINEHAAVVG